MVPSAATVSTTLNKAIGQAKQVKDITLSQGSRNSYPIYDNKGQKITGWRERAEVRLESADFAALSFLGKLKSIAHGKKTAHTPKADQCRACGLCVVACPEQAITLERM